MNENNNGSNKNMYVLLGIGAVVVLLLVALWGSFNSPNSEGEKTSDTMSDTKVSNNRKITMPESTESNKKMAAGEVKEFTLEAGSFYYKPNVIKVKEGDTVKVTLNSVDMMHNFYLDEFDVKSENAKSGETVTVEFLASKKGTYEFYCQVGKHRANGQVGTLIVE